jgi:hypothetical protein
MMPHDEGLVRKAVKRWAKKRTRLQKKSLTLALRPDILDGFAKNDLHPFAVSIEGPAPNHDPVIP